MLQVINLVEIPTELIPRTKSFDIFTVASLLVSLVAIATARYSRENVYKNLGFAIIKGKSLSSFIKESLPNNEWSSHLLIINYFSSSFLLLLLMFGYLDFSLNSIHLTALAIPIIYFIWDFFSMIFILILSGEKRILGGYMEIKLVNIKWLGIINFIAAVLWILNPNIGYYVLVGVMAFFVVNLLLTWIKGLTVALANGATWYYIILYLCTLEILPILIIYYLVGGIL